MRSISPLLPCSCAHRRCCDHRHKREESNEKKVEAIIMAAERAIIMLLVKWFRTYTHGFCHQIVASRKLSIPHTDYIDKQQTTIEKIKHDKNRRRRSKHVFSHALIRLSVFIHTSNFNIQICTNGLHIVTNNWNNWRQRHWNVNKIFTMAIWMDFD